MKPSAARRVAVAVLFTLAGPPAGLLMLVCAEAFTQRSLDAFSVLEGITVGLVMTGLSYLVAGPAALMTGLVAAALAGWADRPLRFGAATAAAGFVSTAAWAHVAGPFRPSGPAPEWHVAARMGGVGAGAALICVALLLVPGALSRRHMRAGPASPIIPPKT